MKGVLFVTDGFDATLNPELKNLFTGATYLDGSEVDESSIEEGNIVVSENLEEFAGQLHPDHSDEIGIQEAVDEEEFFEEMENYSWVDCKYTTDEIKEKLKELGECRFYSMGID